MIVVDVKGNYIEVIVPNRTYRKAFVRNLSEGKWFYLENFHVFPSKSTCFALNTYEIRCMWETTMVSVSDKTSNNFYHFVFPSEVENALDVQFHHVTECCETVVKKVSTILSSPSYNYQPIVAMMRFWRVQAFEGKNVVMSVDDCARVYINPTFEDFDLEGYIEKRVIHVMFCFLNTVEASQTRNLMLFTWRRLRLTKGWNALWDAGL
ncbi:predicted protein [Arabidopsis lyrata subsp. lyrata]|uniref:Predicted protein n=1 Tax=Arabidopsis lyrata subsp. lyrata TaxID=81972 RepID=D7M4J6_ARALL|nr:predicted protein [Arabidopsis lyrata subsp. lyrata]